MRAIWCIFILLLTFPCFGQEQEYQIKAVFLEHFTRFIEWPNSSTVADPSHPFTIAVIGDNPFGIILEQIYTKQKIKNKNVEILYLENPEQVENCHILFISNSIKNRLLDILARTWNKPILTVGDTEGFSQKNVLVNFYLSENKLKFEINEKAVHESGLVMSYMLLNLAKIVNPVRERK